MSTQDNIADPATAASVLGLYHININATNLERTQEFYEKFGFRVVDEFGQAGQPSLDLGLGVAYSDTRAIFMAIGRNQFETVLDICEWNEPATIGDSPTITTKGVARIALRVKNIDALVDRLEKQGVDFISKPMLLDFLKRPARFCICRDPDGLFVELVELLKR